ncbi:hypothetical protein [Massilia cavernae]|uniref:DUF1640 domain-containing protein n=1 Tax=Massilia cavernae TaxID=2320864 RepID=A0A418Y5Q9_9BURK|nr:hypothetical protein [Massilia cavernae]RJG22211.1 hypothetical protein D3872_05815 [Massilia cavernae]
MTTHFAPQDYAQRLERAGVPEEHAAAYANLLEDVLSQAVAARRGAEWIDAPYVEVEATNNSPRIDIKYLRWITGAVIALNIAIIVRLLSRR